VEEARRRHADNAKAWDEAADHYASAIDDVVEFIGAGKSSVHPVERGHLGDLRTWCQVAVHLQCASGKDTLSLLNEGVRRVIGVDVSAGMVANAQRASDTLGLPAEWYCCDVLDVPRELDAVADLVYTGRGALVWMHDLPGWAEVVARLLRPGGMVHVFDDHAAAFLFDPDAGALAPSHADYFANVTGARGWPDQYVGNRGRPGSEYAVKHERMWAPSCVFTALTDAGLAVEQFGEHPDEYWRSFPRLSEAERARLPMTFSMTARKPLR
jgi:SAM-dependent methyltransferase